MKWINCGLLRDNVQAASTIYVCPLLQTKGNFLVSIIILIISMHIFGDKNE